MSRRTISSTKSSLWLSVSSIVICLVITMTAHAQTGSPGAEVQGDKNAQKTPPTLSSRDRLSNPTPSEEVDNQYFRKMYNHFTETYKLGPEDELAVRVQGHPEHSLERVKISPMGTMYHNLLGQLTVVGMTVPQLKTRITKDLSEYLVDPQVNVELIDAKSAKVGVIGGVINPGIQIITRPMKIVDIISGAGGFDETGSKDNVTVLRQSLDGKSNTLRVNVKRILDGKAKPEENIAVQAGDLVIVHGNTLSKISKITSLAGFGGFLSFISVARTP
jgi:protein involved in polysaccharide export with SLBB domain